MITPFPADVAVEQLEVSVVDPGHYRRVIKKKAARPIDLKEDDIEIEKDQKVAREDLEVGNVGLAEIENVEVK